MRFMIVNTDYNKFLNELYSSNLGLAESTYEHQLKIRYESLFGMNDFRSRNLIAAGHEAIDIYINNLRIQNTWIQEHGKNLSEEAIQLLQFLKNENFSIEYQILGLQIHKFKPDVLLLDAMDTVRCDFLRIIKPLTKLILGCGEPPVMLNTTSDFSVYDLVLAASPKVQAHFAKKNINSTLYYFGFESTLLSILPELPEKKYEVTFIGGLTEAHRSRVDFLEELSKHIPLTIFSPDQVSPEKYPGITAANKGGVFGKEMYMTLMQSKIALNMHIDIAGDYADNMRLFEATGVGTFLLTDHKSNIEEYFVPGAEIETYNSFDSCVQKIQYYLQNDSERERIARAGHKKTLHDHTYAIRANQLINICKNHSRVMPDNTSKKTDSIMQISINSTEEFFQLKPYALQNRFGNFVLNYHGLQFHCHDLLSFYMAAKDIFIHKIYDFQSTTPNPVIIDGGGHIGLFTLFIKQKYPAARVTIFEPDDLSYELLVKNLEVNNIRDVNIVKAGLFNREGTLSFGSDNSDGSSIFSEDGGSSIETTILSKYLHQPVDFVKLNIEGAEMETLSELGDKLQLIRELVIEYHGFPSIGQRLHSILEILHNHGFRYLIHDFDKETNPACKPPFSIDLKRQFFLLIYGKKILPVSKSNTNTQKLAPVSRKFGFDRGTPIDRFYIESFLEKNRHSITGDVLEIAENTYTKKFGMGSVTSHILSFEAGSKVTIVGDLAAGKNIPSEAYDSIILTQTIQMIYDFKSAIRNAYNALKPGGSILLTASGISQISRYDMDRWGEYWRFTDCSMRKVAQETCSDADIHVETFGNYAAAVSFLDGRSVEETGADVLLPRDQDYQILVCARITKPGTAKVHFEHRETDNYAPTILLYHRVNNDPIDSQLLAVSPQNFHDHIEMLSKTFQVISLKQMTESIRHGKIHPHSIAITFDDGYVDNLQHALPVLEKFNAPATIFVTRNMVDAEHEFWWDAIEQLFLSNSSLPSSLSFEFNNQSYFWDVSKTEGRIAAWEGLQAILKKQPTNEVYEFLGELFTSWAGISFTARKTHRIVNSEELTQLASSPLITIGSHTLSHPSLSQLGYNEQFKEIYKSKLDLESLTGKAVEFISYPFGTRNDFNQTTMEIAEKIGYSAGIANIQAELPASSSLFALPRRLVRNWSSSDLFDFLTTDNKQFYENSSLAKRADILKKIGT